MKINSAQIVHGPPLSRERLWIRLHGSGKALLEALGNALFIAPAERVDGPGALQPVSVDRTTRRYRVRPLLGQPGIRFFRNRNIVHWRASRGPCPARDGCNDLERSRRGAGLVRREVIVPYA